MILIAIRAVINSLCPFTSKLGSVLGILDIVAFYVFVIIAFFVAPHWWHVKLKNNGMKKFTYYI